MSETIITALITAAVTLAGVIVQSRAQHSATMAELRRQSELSDASLDSKLAVMDTKIEELTREVRQHNGHNERISILEEKASAANRRLSELEHRAG